MADIDIKGDYKELQKKYSLPEFKELDEQFEISTIEDSLFLLRSIISKIMEKLEFYTKMLEELLHPETSNLYAIREYRFFDDNEKKQMYDVYRRLMHFNRYVVEVDLNASEQDEANYIVTFSNEWKSIKKSLQSFVKKMKDSWGIDTDIKEDIQYFG